MISLATMPWIQRIGMAESDDKPSPYHTIRRTIIVGLVIVLLSTLVPGQVTEPLQPTPLPSACNDYILQSTGGKDLSKHQRLCLAISSIVSPSAVSGAIFFAEVRRSPAEWKGGIPGLSKRFASNLARSMTKSATESVIAGIERKDPRFAALTPDEYHSQKARLGKALTMPIIDWHSSKRVRLDYIAGALASGFAGMMWYPPTRTPIHDALNRSLTAFGGYVLASTFTEYRADIVRGIGRLFGLH